ncbi:MAG: extracellular solute-binding protein [Anaerolineaceae bacterium]|nr:extracellular solute-binding protein [Anaerolineaceae bacterium]
MSGRKLMGLLVVVLAALSLNMVSAQEKFTLSWITDLPGAEDIAAAFAKDNSNIEVRVDKVTFNEVFAQNQVRLGSGSSDLDIVSVDAPLVASYGSRGWLLALDDQFDQKQIDSWVDALYASGKYDGKLYAPPIWNSTQLLYINQDLFKASGVTPPAFDERWTWDQVTEAAQKLTKDTDDPAKAVWGFQFEQFNRIYQLQPVAQSLPAPVIGEDGLTVKGIIDSPEWVKAFTWFGSLHNTLNVSPKGTIDAGELFRTGKLAMFVAGPWRIGGFISDPPTFEWSAAPHPYWKEIKVPGDSWHLGVNAKTQHPAEAAAFVKYASSIEADRLWYASGVMWPAHKELLDELINDPANTEFPQKAFVVAANEAQYTEPRPLSVAYLEYEQILSETFEDIRNGADVQESLTTAADRIQKEMDKYKTQ